MPRLSLRTILQQSAHQVLRGSILLFFESHREEILQFIKTAQEERGAALLHDLCARFPAAAGVVSTLMGGSPQDAIDNIAQFDPTLAEELQKHIGSVRKMQEAYARGKSTE